MDQGWWVFKIPLKLQNSFKTNENKFFDPPALIPSHQAW